MREADQGVRVRVWDLPTRTTHWAIALLIPFSWWSAHSGHLPWHRLSGYSILGLLVFRLIWGVWGSSTARFANFIRSPATLRVYLAGRLDPFVGHNPLGGWSIATMLAALAAQLSLGLFSVDEDGIEAGPLAKLVSFDTGRAIARIHHLIFWVLLALIGLHLAAILFYALRRRDLVTPMVTGLAPLPPGAKAAAFAPLWRILPAAAAAAAIVWFIARGLRL